MFRSSLALALALALVGCGSAMSISPRGTAGNPAVPRGNTAVLDPRLNPQPGDVPSTVPPAGPRATASEQRRVCRTSGTPRGWIAVAYESGSADCPAEGDSEYRVAVLVSLKSQLRDATLDVCGDQHVPIDWTEERDAAVDNGQCPGALKDGRSATKRIRRNR